ncbi:MAG: hypothetical protein WD595_02390 [Waddliaceae bacterium]
MPTLFNNLNNKVISFDDDDWPTFHSKFFENEMFTSGIDIPVYIQNEYEFEGKKLSTVYPPKPIENPDKDDKKIAGLFKKALVEWYYPIELKKEGFYWNK